MKLSLNNYTKVIQTSTIQIFKFFKIKKGKYRKEFAINFKKIIANSKMFVKKLTLKFVRVL